MRAFLASVSAIIALAAIALLLKPELALGDHTRQFLDVYGYQMFAVFWMAFVVFGTTAFILAITGKRTRRVPRMSPKEFAEAQRQIDEDAREFVKKVGDKPFSQFTAEEMHEYESIRLREGMLGEDR